MATLRSLFSASTVIWILVLIEILKSPRCYLTLLYIHCLRHQWRRILVPAALLRPTKAWRCGGPQSWIPFSIKSQLYMLHWSSEVQITSWLRAKCSQTQWNIHKFLAILLAQVLSRIILTRVLPAFGFVSSSHKTKASYPSAIIISAIGSIRPWSSATDKEKVCVLYWPLFV